MKRHYIIAFLIGSLLSVSLTPVIAYFLSDSEVEVSLKEELEPFNPEYKLATSTFSNQAQYEATIRQQQSERELFRRLDTIIDQLERLNAQ